MAGPRTTRGATGETRFGALLLDAVAGVERDFCDRGDTGAEATVTFLADEGIMAGTCAGVFSLAGGDGFLGDAMGGDFVSDGVDDALLTGGTAGCASSEIANGEI